jgi:nicotinic acid mononucleotide adenylyltransferase
MYYSIEFDCLYKNFKNLYLNRPDYKDLLIKSGFINENRNLIDQEAIQDLNLLSLPIVEENINKDNLAVIVTTGSFSPIHNGHLYSLELAKKYVESLGYNILQGVISLSHDKYVDFKNNGICKMNVSKRTNLVYNLIKETEWIKVDRFEGEMVSCPINFSTVIERIKKYIEYHINKKVTIFYLFGSDNSNFSYSFVNNSDFQSICVERKGYSFDSIKDELKIFKNIHFIKNNSEYSSLSSTLIRDSFYNSIKESSNDSNLRKIYFIRTDDAPLDFCIKLKDIVKKYVNEDVEIKLFSSADFIKPIGLTISLDKYIKGDYSLDLSRLFTLCDFQNKPKKMISLSDNFDTYIKTISQGTYTLFDDDSVSGYTMHYVEQILNEFNIFINQKVSLIQNLVNKDEILYDVIDARDFILGANKGGLVVSLFGNKNIRVPYIFPFVNLTTRANILPEYQIIFTKEIINENLKLCKDTDNIYISEYLMYNNKELMKHYLKYINNYLDTK